MDEQDNTTTRSVTIPSPRDLPYIHHLSMIHGPLIFTRFAELTAKHDHPGWPKTPEQFIAVLFLLEMEDVFQEFLQNKSGCLDPLFQEYHHNHTFFR